MHRTILTILRVGLLMSLTTAYGQSLGDIARENREKQDAEEASGTVPKVITNKDLPARAEADAGPSEAGTNNAASQADDHRFIEQRVAEQRSAEQWSRAILGQENKITNLQARIDQINRSIHSVGGSAEYEGPYNRYQARQLQRIARIQERLDEQERKLEAMQDAARHAGMHTLAYDP
jgi:hypothetical protein